MAMSDNGEPELLHGTVTESGGIKPECEFKEDCLQPEIELKVSDDPSNGNPSQTILRPADPESDLREPVRPLKREVRSKPPVVVPEKAIGDEPAGFVRRASASLVDASIVALMGFPLVFVVVAVNALLTNMNPFVFADVVEALMPFFFCLILYFMEGLIPVVFSLIYMIVWLGPAHNDMILGSPMYIFCFAFLPLAVNALYHALFLSSPWQATPGKRLAGIYVRTDDGKRLSLGRALIRHFVRAVSIAGLGLGIICGLRTPRQRCLHDLAAGTVVVPGLKSKSGDIAFTAADNKRVSFRARIVFQLYICFFLVTFCNSFVMCEIQDCIANFKLEQSLKKDGPSSESAFNARADRLALCFAHHNPKSAMVQIEELATQAKNVYGESSEKYATILLQEAQLTNSQRDDSQALAAYEKAFDVIRRHHIRFDELIIPAGVHADSPYYEMRDLRLGQREVDNFFAQMANLNLSVGSHYLRTTEPKKAMPYIDRALAQMQDLIDSRPKDGKTVEYLVTYSYQVLDSVRELDHFGFPQESKRVLDDASVFIKGNQWLEPKKMTELLQRIAGKGPSD